VRRLWETTRAGNRYASDVALIAPALILVLLASGWPVGRAAWELGAGVVTRGLLPPPEGDAPWSLVDWRLLASTVLWAAVIAGGATVLSLPIGWALRGVRGSVASVAVLPMLVPSTLAYAAYNLARSPDTAIGIWIERASSGGTSLPVALGRGIAAVSLILWASGIAAIVMVPAASRISDATLDALRSDGAGVFRRAMVVLAMLVPSLAGAWCLVFVLMLGSAVPLHLAQIDTFATRVWLMLEQTPAADRWRVWLGAWPVIGASMLASVGVVSVATGLRHAGDESPSAARRGPGGRGAVVVAALVLVAGVLVPLAILTLSVRMPGTFWAFWRVSGVPLARSCVLAVCCGAGAALLTLAFWRCWGMEGRFRRLAGAALWILAMTGLAPGILVGAWTHAAWRGGLGAPIRESGVIVALACIARFGWICGLAGAWLAASEPADRRAMRHLDGDSLRAWLGGTVPGGRRVVAFASIGVGLLSFHEIEVAVWTVPPGFELLSRQLLGYLHFSRMDELAAAMSWVVGAGVGVWVVSIVASRVGGRDRSVHP
jgi:hypothetical protein